MEFQEQMSMILYYLHGMDSISLFRANIVEDQLAILFNSLIVEYLVSILRHQHYVIGDLSIAMAKTMQFQRISHPSQRRGGTTMVMVPKTTSFYKEAIIHRFKRKASEDSLHPRHKDRGIRDPPHSLSNNK